MFVKIINSIHKSAKFSWTMYDKVQILEKTPQTENETNKLFLLNGHCMFVNATIKRKLP